MQRVLQLAPPVETPGWLQFVRPVHEDATLRLQEETMVVDHGNGVFPEHLLSALDLESLAAHVGFLDFLSIPQHVYLG